MSKVATGSTQTSLTREQKQAVGLLSIGTFLEYFDLMIYIHMAVLLNELFFPKYDPYINSLLTAFAFCSTYVMRPIGALIFGYIGDNIGRKSTVIITTATMATCCIIMANLPTYEQIGITASILITGCRILQGMSSVGEVVGAQLYLTETIDPPKSYMAVASIPLSVSIGSSAALIIASIATIPGVNWRMAFWVGACIAVVGVLARIGLRETPEFVNAKLQLKKSANNEGYKIDNDLFQKIYSSTKIKIKTLLSLFFLDCMWPLCFYITYVICAGILKNQFGYTSAEVIHQNLIVSIFQIMNCFTFFILCKYLHPLVILKFKFIISGLTLVCLPFFLDYIQTGFGIMLLQILLIFFTCDASPASSIFFKYFPVFKRFTYVSFTYALSRAITYIVTSFGFVICMEYFGRYGFWIIILPMCTMFWISLKHFQNLEFRKKVYNNVQ